MQRPQPISAAYDLLTHEYVAVASCKLCTVKDASETVLQNMDISTVTSYNVAVIRASRVALLFVLPYCLFTVRPIVVVCIYSGQNK